MYKSLADEVNSRPQLGGPLPIKLVAFYFQGHCVNISFTDCVQKSRRSAAF